jgi:diadenosine tetraphosphatase ApaH/serine/threonine PP2A family protein phosphatase
MSRTILIGDIHGCFDELQRLLETVAVGPADRVVLVGDLVAKGPDSRAVVHLARTRGFQAVLGNHDAHVLKWRTQARARAVAKERTHHFDVAQSLSEDDVAWLQSLPVWLRLPTEGVATLVVHGGLVPGIAIEDQDRNFLINLRSVLDDGTPSKRIDGTPWAALWKGPEHVVFGHDALRGLQQHPFATGLDTGCVYGGRLTALILPERKLVSVAASRTYCAID